MQTFKRYIEESTKIKGKIAPFERIVFDAYVDFFKNKFDIKGDIKLKVTKRMNKLAFGSVNITDMSKGIYEMTIKSGSLPYTFHMMAHEITHIQQYMKGRLSAVDDMITWDGEPYISVADYNKIKYNEYKELPWEKEAIENSNDKSLQKEFMNSVYYKNMAKSNNSTIDFILDTGLF